MADVTLRLIWYRLGEASTNMAERYERFLEWYEDFSVRRVDILDMLFLGWLLVAFVVVGAINIYLKFFGRPKLRGLGYDGGVGGGILGGVPGALPGGGEPCQWLNSVLNWIYLHSDTTPLFVDSWLRSLNEHARKQSTQLQVKFDRIQPGSLPPKLTMINTEAVTRDSLTVRATVEATDMLFLVSALQQQGQTIKVSNCDVAVQRLIGQLKIISHFQSEQIDITASFPQPPDIQLHIRPRNEAVVDSRLLEQIVRTAISNGCTQFTIPAKGGFAGFTSQYGGTAGGMGLGSTAGATGMAGGVMRGDRIEPLSSAPVGSARPLSMRDRRLLVKIIKANGLGEKDYGCSDPYCIVYMDEPAQKHTTSVVKSTVNPFWDEHFLFDLDDNTKQIKFEVFDREKPPGEDFLGRALIPVSDLRRMPSSRQIIPLSGKPGSTGTITVEFLFMEPAEASQLQAGGGSVVSDFTDSVSPRRRIDTNRTVTPGGTFVTTTTTTTEKPRDVRLDASFNEAGKAVTNEPELIPGERSGTGIRRTGSFNRPMAFDSPHLTVTSPYGAAGAPSMSAQTTTGQPSPVPSHDGHSVASAPVDAKDMKKSKSFASALRKRFQRPKKPRSHSADRAGALRDENLLKPEGYSTRTTDAYNQNPTVHRPDDLEQTDIPGQSDTLRKSRSHSFSSSLKRIFRKKKKGEYPSSRESSISRASTRPVDDMSMGHGSPYMSPYEDRYTEPSREGALLLSTSVPVSSPLHDH